MFIEQSFVTQICENHKFVFIFCIKAVKLMGNWKSCLFGGVSLLENASHCPINTPWCDVAFGTFKIYLLLGSLIKGMYMSLIGKLSIILWRLDTKYFFVLWSMFQTEYNLSRLVLD